MLEPIPPVTPGSIEVSNPAGRTTWPIRPTDEICNGKPVSRMKKKHEKIKDASNGRLGTVQGKETFPLRRPVKPIGSFAL